MQLSKTSGTIAISIIICCIVWAMINYFNYSFSKIKKTEQSKIATTEKIDSTIKDQTLDDGMICGIGPDAEYKGGMTAWRKFLRRSLIYPEKALAQKIQGTVMVQFIIDKEGNVGDVVAINGPEELRPSAIAVIKKSGKWTPALQNGRYVKSYKKQPITFKLLDEQ